MSVEEDLCSGSDEVVVWWKELEEQIQEKFVGNLFDVKDKDD